MEGWKIGEETACTTAEIGPNLLHSSECCGYLAKTDSFRLDWVFQHLVTEARKKRQRWWEHGFPSCHQKGLCRELCPQAAKQMPSKNSLLLLEQIANYTFSFLFIFLAAQYFSCGTFHTYSHLDHSQNRKVLLCTSISISGFPDFMTL